MKKKVLSLLTVSILCPLLFASSVTFNGQVTHHNVSQGQMVSQGRFRPRKGNMQRTAYVPSQIKNAYGISKLTATGKNEKLLLL